jgi:hypothetical protein
MVSYDIVADLAVEKIFVVLGKGSTRNELLSLCFIIPS